MDHVIVEVFLMVFFVFKPSNSITLCCCAHVSVYYSDFILTPTRSFDNLNLDWSLKLTLVGAVALHRGGMLVLQLQRSLTN